MLIKQVGFILLMFKFVGHGHDFGLIFFFHFKCLQGLGKAFQLVNQNVIVSC